MSLLIVCVGLPAAAELSTALRVATTVARQHDMGSSGYGVLFSWIVSCLNGWVGVALLSSLSKKTLTTYLSTTIQVSEWQQSNKHIGRGILRAVEPELFVSCVICMNNVKLGCPFAKQKWVKVGLLL